MNQNTKAETFKKLHEPGNPLVLYNIWDAGSAKTLVEAGAPAIATGSWSVAAAHGYPDGEAMPLFLLVTVAERIAASVDVPVSIDFEGGFAKDPAGVRENVKRLTGAGIIGINLEDQVVGGEGLYAPEEQAQRIAAAVNGGEDEGVSIFINARTDLFLQEPDQARHGALIAETIERGAIYREAGASGFFVPGLVDPDLIARICEGVSLPVNVMKSPAAPDIATLARVGVARVSHGPGPYRRMIEQLKIDYRQAV